MGTSEETLHFRWLISLVVITRGQMISAEISCTSGRHTLVSGLPWRRSFLLDVWRNSFRLAITHLGYKLWKKFFFLCLHVRCRASGRHFTHLFSGFRSLSLFWSTSWCFFFLFPRRQGPSQSYLGEIWLRRIVASREGPRCLWKVVLSLKEGFFVDTGRLCF